MHSEFAGFRDFFKPFQQTFELAQANWSLSCIFGSATRSASPLTGYEVKLYVLTNEEEEEEEENHAHG